MRKKLVPFIAALASGLVSLTAVANDIEPGKEFYDATRTSRPIVIDGNLSEWSGVPVLSDPKFAIPKGSGSKGTYVLFEPYNGGTWTGPDDQTSAVQVAWDAENVYFGFVVTDDYHENSRNSAWNGDSVQLMLANADRTQRISLVNYALGGVEGALGDVIIHHEAGPVTSEPAAETTAVVTRNATTKKTIYEIKIPAAAIGLTPPLTAGTKFGLGMAINDGDDGPNQDGQKGWGGLGAHSIVFGKTPGETALVTLSAATPTVDRIFLSAINPTGDTFSFRATDKGASIVDAASAKLTVDGKAAPLTSKKTGDATDFTHTFKPPLAAGSDHTYAIEVKDTQGNAVTAQGNFKVANKPVELPVGTLFIEAEDFNFNKGQWLTNKAIGMTGKYPGGDYRDLGTGVDGAAGDGSDFGIDYFDNNAINDGGASPPYRPGTAVEIAKPNGPAGVTRPGFDVEVNHVVGWTGSGEWMNYTRQFPTNPPNQLYKVYARMASGDAANPRHGELARITSDPTKPNQTKEVLGTFNAPWTGGWDIWPAEGTPADALIPLRDAAGSEVLVKLSGLVTLRFTFLPGASDLDYIAFVPAGTGGLPPKVTSLKPSNGATGIGSQPTLEAVLEDADLGVASASLTFNGSPVSAQVSKTGKVTTARYPVPTALAAGSSHKFALIYTDTASPPVTRTNESSFRVSFTPFPPTTLFIEAEDFNFGKGQWIQDKPIGMNGPYPGGDYQGRGNGLDGTECDGSDFGIDYFETSGSNDQAIYRPTTPVEAGKRNGPAGLNRGSFEVTVNHVLGWNNAGEWVNYTRRFPEPARAYKVYSRQATDAAQVRLTELARVTSDPTKCNQTKEVLGIFSAPTTGAWDTWPDAGTPADALIPLKDSAGGKEITVTLGGLVTLRHTWLDGGASDLDYLAFVPVQPAGPKITAIRRNANGSITLEWTGGGVLQSAAAITGPWTDVPGATSPFTFTPGANQRILFGRIKL